MKDKQIKEILNSFRIQCDMAWSEVVDKAHTQKEYEAALKRIQNTHILSVEKLISSALTTQKELFIKIIESKRKDKEIYELDDEGGDWNEGYEEGYSRALDDLKAELTKLEEEK